MLSAPDRDPDGIAALASRVCGHPVSRADEVKGGGNNRIYRLETPDGELAFKIYVRDANDPRDRLNTEFTALSFLNRHDVSYVPAAVARDDDAGVGIYGWIDGSTITAPGQADIDAVIEFVRVLARASGETAAAALEPASEACLSARELVAQIERRCNRLRTVPSAPLARFLDTEFQSAMARLSAHADRTYGAAGLSFDDTLPAGMQTLSQSDFGFHNALRTPAGDLVFVDFEYFGWDDPVKLTADFLLHPGFDLDDALKRRFSGAMHDLFAGNDAGFGDRLRALYPLYALRWAMIMLNPFLPEWLARRGGNDPAGAALCNTRLKNAHDMLMHALSSEKGFPYE